MTHALLNRPVAARRVRRKPTVVMTKMDEFLSHINPSLSPASQQVVIKCLWSLRRGLKGQEPTTEHLLAWLRHRITVDKVKASTLSLERTYCSRFFTWCVEQGYLDKNPLTIIPSVPVRVVNKPLITEEQKAQLIRAGEGTFWPYLIELAWATGARSSDLVALRWTNIDSSTSYEGGGCWLVFTPKKTAASGREVRLPLPQRLHAIVDMRRDVRRDNSLICPEAKTIHDRGNGDFQTSFRRLCDKAGLPKTITFHCFRHTRASRMLSGDDPVSLFVAADVLGLSSLATLRKYTKASDAAKLKAVNL